MSKDRVRFTLAPRYFSGRSGSTNGMERQVCMEILRRAFSMSPRRVAG